MARFERLFRLSAVAAACALCLTPAVPVRAAGTSSPEIDADLQAQVTQGLARFERDRNKIVAATGSELAYDLQRRLRGDEESLREPIPENISPERWRETLANIVALDVAAIAGLATGSPTTLTTAPGLHEILLRLHVDGTLQPAALYIPVGFRADERVPLAIVLHGRPQSESELLGPFVLRDLADASRTILLAPYGHGNYDFAEPAATDVYDAAAAVGNALPVDARRTYLVG